MKVKNANKKPKAYGEPVRIKSKTIALIDRIITDEIPFNTKLFKIVEDYALIKGVIVKS